MTHPNLVDLRKRLRDLVSPHNVVGVYFPVPTTLDRRDVVNLLDALDAADARIEELEQEFHEYKYSPCRCSNCQVPHPGLAQKNEQISGICAENLKIRSERDQALARVADLEQEVERLKEIEWKYEGLCK